MIERQETYLDNLIAPDKLIDVLPRTSIKKQTCEIERAFPRLEAAFVEAGAEVRLLQLVYDLVVLRAFFAEELHADIVQLPSGQMDRAASWRFYLDSTVTDALRECGELRDMSILCRDQQV